ncbi:hypothetical protein [Phenylobacterium sp.]|uniref:hypothetical protein n=1 Tax=Phenylobacterium sp. TaxID=1871053 RepID=UPI00271ADE25|nr:hypothetical protein [Phenylobacterium sp.]MDO8800089.1 hypothetical protein [Phenylobacterium sp.]
MAQVLHFPPRPARAMPIDMAARVATNAADLRAWQRSPGGRLVAALNTLEALDFGNTAGVVDKVYRQSLCDPSQVDPAAVGAALKDLLSISPDHPLAHLAALDGCRALADMLAEPQTQGAA